MFGRLNLVVFSIGFVVLTGVVLVALFVPGDTVTRVIAVFGVIVSLSKAAYDVWDKERERRKKTEEKRERIKATPVFTPLPALQGYRGIPGFDPDNMLIVGITVYNEGVTPVNIKSVTLVKDAAHGQVERTALVINQTQPSVKLQPHDNELFLTEGLNSRIKGSTLRASPPDSFYIQVESHQGVVATVPGHVIQECITKTITSPDLY